MSASSSFVEQKGEGDGGEKRGVRGGGGVFAVSVQ